MCACQQITRLHVWFLHTLHIYINYMHYIAFHCIPLQYIHTYTPIAYITYITNIKYKHKHIHIAKSHHITSNDIALQCKNLTYILQTYKYSSSKFRQWWPPTHQTYMRKFPKNSNCTHHWLRSLGLAVFSSIFKDGTFAAASAAAPTIGGRGLSCEFQENPTFMPRFSHKKAQGLFRSYEAHYGVP